VDLPNSPSATLGAAAPPQLLRDRRLPVLAAAARRSTASAAAYSGRVLRAARPGRAKSLIPIIRSVLSNGVACREGKAREIGSLPENGIREMWRYNIAAVRVTLLPVSM
jgi:hypothetical protein